MSLLTPTPDMIAKIKLAGLLYLVVILTGLGGELGLRAPLIDLADADGTAAAILGAPGQFRLAIAADILMALCDAGLAVLFYLIFCPMAPALALLTMILRLIQTVLIAVSVMALLTAWLILTKGDDLTNAAPLALIFLDLHAHGYDLGLIFFGVNSLFMAVLVWRSGQFARIFALGLAAAGGVYLVGSGLRFFAPEWSTPFTPVYLVTILAETAFCLRLLFQKKRP
ncbi:DUF4386 domain-containing protein [Cohaesibacter sp. CAU 1516]|uniref:DUF4386 domain-containing protein n=1 Tax=Cohaesibacter sp. CAU 1516 TaxID=2576038 RepID=UPI0010FE337E|nr:DUF4386 domain-containing protein [Cohaesibacter sp. CAU 1516]TLP44213.1 DUF4386 domain-containing protein [Cohaesibacter sp. CAU 1516]